MSLEPRLIKNNYKHIALNSSDLDIKIHVLFELTGENCCNNDGDNGCNNDALI